MPKRDLEEFITLSNELHNNRYNYDNVIYIDNLTKISIICHLHGKFDQLPKCHLRGNGCTKCSFVESGNKKILRSKEKFFDEIKIKDYENRWDYSEVEFTGTNNVISLKCNGCQNKTTRTPHNHLYKFQPCKRGCFIIKNKDYELKEITEVTNLNSNMSISESKEEWKTFLNNENYLVSNRGYIKNKKSKKVIYGSLDKTSGYMRTAIDKKAYMIHRIIAETFLPNLDDKPTVNHKNKNRTDNRIENLEWATYSEQNYHKTDIKTYKNHNNGKNVLRINKDTNETETYDSIMQASKWIMENVHKKDTTNKDIQKELENISSSLSQKIKRNKNNWFGYNYIWKIEEKTLQKTEENEIWKPMDSGYFISNFGKIKNPSDKIKDNFGITGGYYEIKINKKHLKIHRLVAEYFIENPENKPFVNHKNSNKFDNRVENLEWVTNQENVIHAYKNDLNSNVTPVIQYDKEGQNVIKEFKSISDASKELNIDSSSISACCREITTQTNGFHFKYKSNMNKKIRNKKENFTCGKRVNKFDKNNILIQTFNTLIECAKFHNVSTSIITNKINEKISKNEELNNYFFKFD